MMTLRTALSTRAQSATSAALVKSSLSSGGLMKATCAAPIWFPSFNTNQARTDWGRYLPEESHSSREQAKRTIYPSGAHARFPAIQFSNAQIKHQVFLASSYQLRDYLALQLNVTPSLPYYVHVKLDAAIVDLVDIHLRHSDGNMSKIDLDKPERGQRTRECRCEDGLDDIFHHPAASNVDVGP